MGNQMSVPQRDQEDGPDTDTPQAANGDEQKLNRDPGTVVSTHTVHYYDEVDLGISVQRDTGDTSSPPTMELSAGADVKAGGKNLGPEARSPAPAARSRFSLTLSRPVPGRAEDGAPDSSQALGTPDVSPQRAPGDKGPSDRPGLPAAAAARPDPDKSLGNTGAPGDVCSATAEPGGENPAKPKESSFLDKLFKLDRAQAKVPAENTPGTASVEPPAQPADIPGAVRPCSHGSAEADLVAREEKGQEVGPASCSLPLDKTEEHPQATATETHHPIMSFFKTLVSPSKAETKKDPEDTGTEKSPAPPADLESDKVSFAPQETSRGSAKNPTPTDSLKEEAKEKGAPTSLPLGKLFWKKSGRHTPAPTGTEENVVCESPVEAQASEEVESTLHTVDLSEGGEATPGPAEAKPKREDRKPSRASLRAFFRQMSVKGDGGTSHSGDASEKDASSQTSNSTEKIVAPPGPEPAVATPKGKEGPPKDKKAPAAAPASAPATPVVNKPRANQPHARAPSPEPAAADESSRQNGDGAGTPRRPEKWRPPLGGFFRSLGPKRMLDAQVQTEPVSIGPIGKSK